MYQQKIVSAEWWDENWKALVHTFLKARRVGGSEAGAIRALTFALGRRLLPDGDHIREVPMPGIVVSKDYRGAKELLGKVASNVREWADAGDEECRQAVPFCHETKIVFPVTGIEIKAIACSPTSIRGSTGFVILDEFPFARLQEDVWGAAKIVTDPNLANARGYPALVIGTPWEAGSFAHQIFTDDTILDARNRFVVDIDAAIADGFPADKLKLFRELAVQELIDTEYLCKWSRSGESFFSLDKLRACTVDDDFEGRLEDDLRGPGISGLPLLAPLAPCRVGIDCGGGVGRDFTAIVMWRLIENRWWLTGIKASNSIGTVDMADQAAEWILDKSIVDPTVQVDVRCDRGVMGADFIVQLRKRLEDRTRTTIMGVGMSTEEQQAYALAGRKLLERDQMRIYLGDGMDGDINGGHAFMLELSRLKARRGQGGALAFTTPRDPHRGHCDRAWAGLIGLEGAELGGTNTLLPSQLHQLYGNENSIWGHMDLFRGFG